MSEPKVRPGQVDATVQILTTDQARAEVPELFVDDGDGPYFNMFDATGNGHWVDFWPDMVMIVRNPAGYIVAVSNVSDWHMKVCGYGVPR